MAFDITLASTSDWEQVRAVRLRSLREEPYAFCSTYAREEAFTELDWQERLATAHTFLARGPADVLRGLVTAVWLRNGDMALTGMYVAPEARGEGCAHGLIGAVVDLTRHRGGQRVVLGVKEGCDRAVRCYLRFGFAPTGRRSGGQRGAAAEIEYAYLIFDGTGDVSPRG